MARVEKAEMLVRQIERSGLLVRVIWLGSAGQEAAVRHLSTDAGRREANKSVLFLAWKPSAITESGGGGGGGAYWASVIFPACDSQHYSIPNPNPDSGASDYSGSVGAVGDQLCLYARQRFEKVHWARLKSVANLAYAVSFIPSLRSKFTAPYPGQRSKLAWVS